jgi:hypothetical protein
MVKDKGQDKQKGNGMYRLYLQAVCLAWGMIPHPTASIQNMQSSLKTRLVQFGSMDPELPDDLLTLIIPALKTRGKSDAYIKEVVMNQVSGEIDEDTPPVEDFVLEDYVASTTSTASNVTSVAQGAIAGLLMGPLGLIFSAFM